jgi:hypothetical protein
MRLCTIITLCILVLSCFIPGAVSAQRCGASYIVKEGVAASEVLKHCGEPDSKSEGSRSGVEIWTYNSMSGEFGYELVIRNGSVAKISKLGVQTR